MERTIRPREPWHLDRLATTTTLALQVACGIRVRAAWAQENVGSGDPGGHRGNGSRRISPSTKHCRGQQRYLCLENQLRP
jgi:hypothetical protein